MFGDRARPWGEVPVDGTWRVVVVGFRSEYRGCSEGDDDDADCGASFRGWEQVVDFGRSARAGMPWAPRHCSEWVCAFFFGLRGGAADAYDL